jgi:hypothetical protein
MIPGADASAIRLQRAGSHAKRTLALAAATTKDDSSASASKPLRKQVQCGRCGRTTSIKLDRAPKAARLSRSKAKAAIEPAPSPADEAASLKNKPNASSKKRAKNRKAGLQSLLAAGQTQKSKSLSLSDFMK